MRTKTMRLFGASSPAALQHAPAENDDNRGVISVPAPGFCPVALAVGLAASALFLTGCETITAPSPDPAAAVTAATPPRRAPHVTNAPRAVDAIWSFRAAATSCAASAAHQAVTLTVAVRDGQEIEIALRPGAATRATRRRDGPHLVFSGPTGSWRARARTGSDRTVVLAQQLDEVAVGQVLMMLEGGTIEVGGSGAGWPALKLPPSGPAGRDWFECVRHQLLS
jgi:hypothetical protein